jgi:uncharacterized glyoxalase superfamily protein PhnB
MDDETYKVGRVFDTLVAQYSPWKDEGQRQSFNTAFEEYLLSVGVTYDDWTLKLADNISERQQARKGDTPREFEFHSEDEQIVVG